MGLLKRMAKRASSKHFSESILKSANFRLLALKYRIEDLNSQARKRKQ